MVGDVIGQGVTYPVKCFLQNGLEAVVKYPRNACGTEVLINEWIGNQIADIVGLSIPRYGLCNLSKDTIQNTNSNEEVDLNNSGVSFYSEYLPKTIPIDTINAFSNVLNREVEKIILFDSIINDEDRHDGNILISWENNKMYFIDCSHIVTTPNHSFKLDIKKEFSESRLLNVEHLTSARKNMYNVLCRRLGFDEDVMLSERDLFKKNLTIDTIDYIFNCIPDDWITGNTNKRIQDMKKIILKKISLVDAITDCIITERRNGKWKNY